jgi:WD40 repeat protein
MAGDIYSMVQTSDKRYLFLSDDKGYLKKIDFKKQKVVKNYGKIHGEIKAIAITSDDKYLWTSGSEMNGKVKQFSVNDGQMIKDHGLIFENDGVRSITSTPDHRWMFAGSREGCMKQISLESQQVVHDYGKIHDDRISYLEPTKDSQWLITCGCYKHVKRISV